MPSSTSFEADPVPFECGREIEQAALESDRARVRDPLDEKVVWILECGQSPGVRPRRGAIERAGRAAPQELMRALVVVLLAKPVEGA